MRPIFFGLASILIFQAGISTCALAEPLPTNMSGSWSGATGGGMKQRSFQVWIVITKQDADGTVEGTVTRHGNGCGAKDEPFKGTYDGTTLRFTSMSRANVNALQANGTCGEDEYIAKRSADGKSFEGTFGDVGAGRWNLVLKP